MYHHNKLREVSKWLSTMSSFCYCSVSRSSISGGVACECSNYFANCSSYLWEHQCDKIMMTVVSHLDLALYHQKKLNEFSTWLRNKLFVIVLYHDLAIMVHLHANVAPILEISVVIFGSISVMGFWWKILLSLLCIMIWQLWYSWLKLQRKIARACYLQLLLPSLTDLKEQQPFEQPCQLLVKLSMLVIKSLGVSPFTINAHQQRTLNISLIIWCDNIVPILHCSSLFLVGGMNCNSMYAMITNLSRTPRSIVPLDDFSIEICM